MKESKETVGKMIIKAREEKGLSKRELSRLAKISDTELARIESGERETPNPKTLRKISKYIGINYNDLMYAAGLGAKISPLNPYLLEYYTNLKGEELRNTYKSINSSIENNKILINTLKKSSENQDTDDEQKTVILDTIEDLEYQNKTNEEIQRLLKETIVKEFADETND